MGRSRGGHQQARLPMETSISRKGRSRLRPRCGRRMEFIAIGGCRGCPEAVADFGDGLGPFDRSDQVGRRRRRVSSCSMGGGGRPWGLSREIVAGARRKRSGNSVGSAFAPARRRDPGRVSRMSPPRSNSIHQCPAQGWPWPRTSKRISACGLSPRRHQAKGGERVGEAAREWTAIGHASDGERGGGGASTRVKGFGGGSVIRRWSGGEFDGRSRDRSGEGELVPPPGDSTSNGRGGTVRLVKRTRGTGAVSVRRVGFARSATRKGFGEIENIHDRAHPRQNLGFHTRVFGPGGSVAVDD